MVAFWDYLVAIGVRYTNEQSWVAPIAAMLLATVWWFAVRLATKHPSLIVANVLGAGVGTLVGILWLPL